jgi:hypothetical protein
MGASVFRRRYFRNLLSGLADRGARAERSSTGEVAAKADND